MTLEAREGAETFEFRAKGRVLVEQGWRALPARDAVREDGEGESEDGSDGKVPMLDIVSTRKAGSGRLLRKETQPPPRYTKASLITRLEAEGIGRPAIYASIMQTS
ncbi:DNA topoisomerase [Oligoflexus tunisiensis]|uniref:DNA topoisomerase n=1 Tax=Oligoflexus tunisiensis TaxID=708132 RepID=UPI00114CE595